MENVIGFTKRKKEIFQNGGVAVYMKGLPDFRDDPYVLSRYTTSRALIAEGITKVHYF